MTAVTNDDMTTAGDEPVELTDAPEAEVTEAEAPEAEAPEVEADEADELDDLLGMAGAEDSEEPAAAPAAIAVPDVNDDGADAAVSDAPEGDAPAAVATAEGVTDEAPVEEVVPARPRRPSKIADVRDQTELRRMIGKWFVVHTYAGYEQRVKDNLTNRIDTYDAWDRILEIVIPTEEVTEYKKGKKVVSDKKFLPGYVLVRMDMDDDTWGIVRHTPAVTGFVGANGVKPVPLSVREVASTLKIPKEYIEETEVTADAAASTPEKVQIDIDMEVGETVRVTTGPFADFTGTIAEINLDQAKLRVLVSVFGRETPIEIPFDNVASI